MGKWTFWVGALSGIICVIGIIDMFSYGIYSKLN